MGLFSQPKPRGFHHEYMFVNPRKDKLRAVENRAKSELGLDGGTAHGHESLRGTFLNATHHARRRHERQSQGGLVLSFGMIVVLLLVLFVVWRLLGH